MSTEQTTGASNLTYNLVSVLYHTLQGSETLEQYISDAEAAGATDAAEFFRSVQEENRRRAQRAEHLLGARLGRGQ